MTLRSRKVLAGLAWMAILGQAVLVASAWILPAVSEYGLIDDNISELALGRLGFIQTAAFVLGGLGTLGLAVAIRGLTPGKRGLIGALLVGVYGAGAILSAVFPTDRIDGSDDLFSLSTSGVIHVAAAIVSFVAVIVSMFLLTWTFMGQARWQPVPWWWMLFPASALSLLFAQGEGPLVGLLQRLLVSAVSAWLVLVAFRIHSIASSRHPDMDVEAAIARSRSGAAGTSPR